MKIAIVIIATLFFSCKSNSQNSKPKANNDSTSFAGLHTNLLSNKHLLIDTSLHFNNFKELAEYKKNFNPSAVNVTVDDSTAYKEYLKYENSILSQHLVFKILKEADKDDVQNFNFLNSIIDNRGIFSQDQLLQLFNSFPEKYRDSKKGIKYLKIINSRYKNLGRSIKDVNVFHVKTKNDKILNFVSLINTDYKFYIILFTASWCGPCRFYSRIYKSTLESLDTSRVKIISISIDTDEKKWKKFLTEENYKWECYMDLNGFKSKILEYFDFNGIPEYFLLDEQGKVLDEKTGFGMDSIINKIRKKS